MNGSTTDEQTVRRHDRGDSDGPVTLVLTFQGPRSAELIAAADRAGRERLGPTLLHHPRLRDEFIGLQVLRRPDGHEIVVVTVRDAATLDVLQELVSSSELLPGEDVSLLPGPDTVEVFQVVEMRGFGVPEVSR